MSILYVEGGRGGLWGTSRTEKQGPGIGHRCEDIDTIILEEAHYCKSLNFEHPSYEMTRLGETQSGESFHVCIQTLIYPHTLLTPDSGCQIRHQENHHIFTPQR